MALDRQTIMRDDFPSNRRGYDPAAVDAHLDRIADEFDELRRQAAVPTPLSAQAGGQVTAIVEAAERGAQEIRDAAHAAAREHVARVTAAADRLRERIEQMERDMTQLVVDLRTGAERLRGDLDEVQAGTEELSDVRREQSPEVAAPEPEPAAPEPEPPAPAAGPAPKNGDSAAARIVALDMALSDQPREDTDRYLAENYDVPDRTALLDEVYAAAGG
ncbi:MAG: DivIVA domain-containing protein [Solirubrobacteraceae bacterium]